MNRVQLLIKEYEDKVNELKKNSTNNTGQNNPARNDESQSKNKVDFVIWRNHFDHERPLYEEMRNEQGDKIRMTEDQIKEMYKGDNPVIYINYPDKNYQTAVRADKAEVCKFVNPEVQEKEYKNFIEKFPRFTKDELVHMYEGDDPVRFMVETGSDQIRMAYRVSNEAIFLYGAADKHPLTKEDLSELEKDKENPIVTFVKTNELYCLLIREKQRDDYNSRFSDWALLNRGNYLSLKQTYGEGLQKGGRSKTLARKPKPKSKPKPKKRNGTHKSTQPPVGKRRTFRYRVKKTA